MGNQRKTGVQAGKAASSLLRSKTSSAKIRKVAASDLSQRAPQPKKHTK